MLILAVAAVGCGPTAAAEPYVNTFASEREAAQAVADALFARDAARLQSLAVTSSEFRKNIWPQLPASRPEVGMPVEYVWGDTSTRSRAGLARALQAYGGRKLAVTHVRFGGPTTDYGSFQLHREAQLTLESADGQTLEARLFGSMITTGDRWKIFSYIID